MGTKPVTPLLAVDIVVLSQESRQEYGDASVSVLLVKRANEPYKDQWVLPGGFVDVGESPHRAARRELREETGLDLDVYSQYLMNVRGEPDRDPRGHVVTLVYAIYLYNASEVFKSLRADSDAKEVRMEKLWWSSLYVSRPQVPAALTLGFDHRSILDEAIKVFW